MSIRVFGSMDELPGDFGPCAITIGNFDGVHAAHRRIMERAVEMARREGWKAAVLTFDPHPKKVLAPERAPRLMTKMEERWGLMEGVGIDEVLVLPFTRDVAQMTPEEFVERVLAEKLGARAVLVGENFRFGARAAGDTRTLRELGLRSGFETVVLPPVYRHGKVVSSSEIRRLIASGNVYRAGRMLERPHFVDGSIVRGHGIGGKKTVPTLNLETDCETLPGNGVYVTRTTDLDGARRWRSITNIGVRPTFGGEGLTIETFLIDPLEGETPERIRVEFLHRVRDERKFESPEALKAQIFRDVKQAQAWFRRAAGMAI